ncbi:hypothetical protein MTO96_025091 [Rhipicephalus appendiculatus]
MFRNPSRKSCVKENYPPHPGRMKDDARDIVVEEGMLQQNKTNELLLPLVDKLPPTHIRVVGGGHHNDASSLKPEHLPSVGGHDKKALLHDDKKAQNRAVEVSLVGVALAQESADDFRKTHKEAASTEAEQQEKPIQQCY